MTTVYISSDHEEEGETKRWVSRRYEVVSFVLTDKFVAVYASEAPDGFVDLYSVPLDALGVARVTEEKVVRHGAKGTPQSSGVSGKFTEIVGLILDEGEWCLANDCRDFAGLAKVGADINACTSHLRGDLCDKLRSRQPAEQPAA